MTWVNGDWVPDKKPPKNPPKKPGASGGGTNGGTGGGGTKAATKAGELTPEQIAELKRRIKQNYNALFGDPSGNRAVPPDLMERALKSRTSDVSYLKGWLRSNLKNGLYLKTTEGKSRALKARQSLEAIFGKDPKLRDKVMEMWLGSDPGLDQDAAWDKFFDTKIVKSKEFKKEFTAWAAFRASAGQRGMTAQQSVDAYRAIQRDAESWYRAQMNDAAATMPPGLLDQLLGAGVTDEASFELFIKNDPTWKAAQEEKAIASTYGQDKGREFDEFWHSVYGADSAPDELLRRGYMKTDQNTTFDEYFTQFIRPSAEFQQAVPGFEKWADSYSGTPGGDTTVDPMLYFKSIKSFESMYMEISENLDVDQAFIQRAMDGNWSAARFELEFKKTPAYKKTAAYTDKVEGIQGYWKSIFGVDAPVDQSIADQFAMSSSKDPTSMFDAIRGTSAFQSQYGNWGDFQAAQDAAGNSGRILANPALYKEYRAAFYQAFADVGMAPPADYERMFFRSGIDENDIKVNMRDYIATNVSYDWQTGQKADVATAAGISDKTAGGNLRDRMAAALAQHKAYAGSKFQTYNTSEKNNFVVKQI